MPYQSVLSLLHAKALKSYDFRLFTSFVHAYWQQALLCIPGASAYCSKRRALQTDLP